MTELKPCPFCGKKPKIENCKDFGYFVKCKCGIEQSTLYAQRCDAVKRWNKRKDEPQRNMAEDIVRSFDFKAESYRQAKAKDEPQTDCSWK